MQSWYTGLSATISTDKWSTEPVPLKIGVYQGDPLSVAIFLTVINTLSDTLSTRKDLGFSLPSSSISINHLLYADDACVISSTCWMSIPAGHGVSVAGVGPNEGQSAQVSLYGLPGINREESGPTPFHWW